MNGGDQQQPVPLQQQYYQPYMYAQQDGQQQQGYPVFQLPPQQYVEQQAAQQQGFYPQIPVQQPQYIFTETNTTEAAEPCQRHCNKRFNAYKIGAAITIASFVAYFIVTPSAFPWFLIIASISAGAMASKYIRDHYADNQPRFRKHAAWYGCINIAFLLLNLWSGGFPFAVVPIAVWGTVLAMHAESIYNRDPLKKGLLRHAIIYAAVGLIVLVAVSYMPTWESQSRFNRMRRPDMKKPKDGKMEAEFTGFRKHGKPSNRPTAVPGDLSTARPETGRPQRPESGRPQETSRPQRPSDKPAPKPQESGKPQQEGRHKGGHHGKGTRQPQGTKKPVDDEDKEHEIRKEYARESARNDTQQRFIMRTVGFIFMLVWSVVLLIHACKTKRSIKRRNHMARNAQPVELQSVDVVQQPNVVLQTGSIQN